MLLRQLPQPCDCDCAQKQCTTFCLVDWFTFGLISPCYSCKARTKIRYRYKLDAVCCSDCCKGEEERAKEGFLYYILTKKTLLYFRGGWVVGTSYFIDLNYRFSDPSYILSFFLSVILFPEASPRYMRERYASARISSAPGVRWCKTTSSYEPSFGADAATNSTSRSAAAAAAEVAWPSIITTTCTP